MNQGALQPAEPVRGSVSGYVIMNLRHWLYEGSQVRVEERRTWMEDVVNVHRNRMYMYLVQRRGVM